jgi:hypothetical protein
VQVPAELADDEKHAHEQLSGAAKKRRTYALEMGTRPQTLYGIADSPIGLASWLLDHGDGYVQPAAALTSVVFGPHRRWRIVGCDNEHRRVLGAIYCESHFNFFAAADASVPAAVSVFPRENYQGAAKLDGARVSQPHLVQPARTGADTLRPGNGRTCSPTKCARA